MSDINLLQSNKSESHDSSRVIKFLNIFGTVIFILALVAAAALYFETKSAAKKTADLNDKVAQARTSIETIVAYPVLVSEQAKIKDLKGLLQKHLDWSQVLPDIFKVTLKSASYSKFTGNKLGGATIAGTVPNFQELDKLMQALQLDDGTGRHYINDVKLLNIGVASDSSNNASGVTFTINITFDRALLNPQLPKVTPVPVNAPQSPSGSSTAPSDSTPALQFNF